MISIFEATLELIFGKTNQKISNCYLKNFKYVIFFSNKEIIQEPTDKGKMAETYNQMRNFLKSSFK